MKTVDEQLSKYKSTVFKAEVENVVVGTGLGRKTIVLDGQPLASLTTKHNNLLLNSLFFPLYAHFVRIIDPTEMVITQ